jgi:hypothetical protein
VVVGRGMPVSRNAKPHDAREALAGDFEDDYVLAKTRITRVCLVRPILRVVALRQRCRASRAFYL